MAPETVLVGAFLHETNTFAGRPTTRESFRAQQEVFGEEIPDYFAGTDSPVGGFLDVAREEDVELVHTVAASAEPGGIVTEDAYDFYTGEILDGIEAHADELDGIALALHGAMVPEGRTDGEGPLLERIREVVGPDLPVVSTLDLHGNVTDEAVERADALVAYETYPHVDTGDTGRRAMRLLLRTIRGAAAPETAIERPPMLPVSSKQITREGPMTETMALAREVEDRPGVLKVSVLPGFHQADVPAMGTSVIGVADGDPGIAEEAAREVAADLWERREEFLTEAPRPAEAVAEAERLVAAGATEDGPVVLADKGDDPGCGSAADGTTVLRELLDRGVENAGFAIMRDPAVVEAGVAAGVGERFVADLGGKTDDLHGDTIEDVGGYVKAITDGRYVNTGPMETGTENNFGRTLRLQCGDAGVEVLVTTNRVQPLDAEAFRHAGIAPERLDVVVVKSTNHFRADYAPMACETIVVDSPGLGAMDPARFDFERIDRPKFPLDEMPADAYPDWE